MLVSNESRRLEKYSRRADLVPVRVVLRIGFALCGEVGIAEYGAPAPNNQCENNFPLELEVRFNL